jgi:hypothetical protein
VDVFTKGEYEDAVALNSTWSDGDWNGNADFTSGDFVTAFTDAGFEKGPRAAVQGVPEPTSLMGVVIAAVIASAGFRRTRRAG